MYIVRWLMGHPIIAAGFLGVIAILLTVGTDEGSKNIQAEDTAIEQEKVVTTDSIKTENSPSDVTTALIASDKKKVLDGNSAEGKMDKPTDSINSEDAMVTKSTVGAIEATSRSYPDGLEVQAKEVEANVATEPAEVSDAVDTSVPSSEEIVTKTTVNALEVTSRSYPTGLLSEAGTETDVVVATEETVSVEATSTEEKSEKVAAKTEDTSELDEGTVNSESIQDLGQTSTEEMLLMAREAYWNNGLDEASQIYIQLIELEPTVIEHRGELGNVYWRQGYPQKAAQLYSEIAIPMIEQGNAERVANMIGFIGLFYPDRAAEIHKRLQSVK